MKIGSFQRKEAGWLQEWLIAKLCIVIFFSLSSLVPWHDASDILSKQNESDLCDSIVRFLLDCVSVVRDSGRWWTTLTSNGDNRKTSKQIKDDYADL